MGSGGSCASGGGFNYGETNARLGELYDQVTSSSNGASSSNFISFVDTCNKAGVDTGLDVDSRGVDVGLECNILETCINEEELNTRLTELNEELKIESELCALVENETLTSAKQLIEDDYRDIILNSKEICHTLSLCGVIEDIVMGEESLEITIEELRDAIHETAYLHDEIEEVKEEPIDDLDKIIEEIRESKEVTQSGILLGRTLELVGTAMCSRYGSLVSSVCGMVGKDLGEDIGNTLHPVLKDFISNFEKAKSDGKSNKDAILYALD